MPSIPEVVNLGRELYLFYQQRSHPRRELARQVKKKEEERREFQRRMKCNTETRRKGEENLGKTSITELLSSYVEPRKNTLRLVASADGPDYVLTMQERDRTYSREYQDVLRVSSGGSLSSPDIMVIMVEMFDGKSMIEPCEHPDFSEYHKKNPSSMTPVGQVEFALGKLEKYANGVVKPVTVFAGTFEPLAVGHNGDLHAGVRK